jgi:hypothetical protein
MTVTALDRTDRFYDTLHAKRLELLSKTVEAQIRKTEESKALHEKSFRFLEALRSGNALSQKSCRLADRQGELDLVKTVRRIMIALIDTHGMIPFELRSSTSTHTYQCTHRCNGTSVWMK